MDHQVARRRGQEVEGWTSTTGYNMSRNQRTVALAFPTVKKGFEKGKRGVGLGWRERREKEEGGRGRGEERGEEQNEGRRKEQIMLGKPLKAPAYKHNHHDFEYIYIYIVVLIVVALPDAYGGARIFENIAKRHRPIRSTGQQAFQRIQAEPNACRRRDIKLQEVLVSH